MLEIGAIVEGKITGLTAFGAFVEFEDGKKGMVHISEVALEFVKDIKDHLTVGQTVKVKVISIAEDGKISLSIKKALEEEQKKQAKVPAQVSFGGSSADMSFEEKMKQFMQDSEEKMSAIKRNMDNKRSGGYKR